MQRSSRKEAGNPNMTTLLPYRDDMQKNLAAEESLTGMNIIMKLNSEQIFALLGSYASDKVKLRVVIKDGKINGLRVVPTVDENDGPTAVAAAQRRKVEIIKCNIVKETNGTIYHALAKSNAEEPSYAVNMGSLDYRLNLINYKPAVGEENLSEVAKYSKLVRIVECIASTVGSEGRSCNAGIYYDPRSVMDALVKGKQVGSAERKEIRDLMGMLRPQRSEEETETETEEYVVAWKWFRLVRSFNCTRWMKRLFQEGYRSNDAYTMIYSGRVDPDMVGEKSREKQDVGADTGYVDKSAPTSPVTFVGSSSSVPSSSKSSVISTHSTSYSRSNSVSTSESRHSTSPPPPPVVVEKEKGKEAKMKEAVESAEAKEAKKTKRSFREYRLSKGLNSGTPSTPASPVIAVPNFNESSKSVPVKRRLETEETTGGGPAKQTKATPRSSRVPETDAEAAELVRTYQSRYATYYRLYQELKGVDGGEEGFDAEKTNRAICRLVEMQNELEMIRWRLGVYSKRTVDRLA